MFVCWLLLVSSFVFPFCYDNLVVSHTITLSSTLVFPLVYPHIVYPQVRKTMTECIMATDMAVHFGLVTQSKGTIVMPSYQHIHTITYAAALRTYTNTHLSLLTPNTASPHTLYTRLATHTYVGLLHFEPISTPPTSKPFRHIPTSHLTILTHPINILGLANGDDSLLHFERPQEKLFLCKMLVHAADLR